MICRSTSARIFPQRGCKLKCKLNEPHVSEPPWQFDDRIIDRSSPPKPAHDLLQDSVRKRLAADRVRFGAGAGYLAGLRCKRQ
jgi:hypothetical protein